MDKVDIEPFEVGMKRFIESLPNPFIIIRYRYDWGDGDIEEGEAEVLNLRFLTTGEIINQTSKRN